MKRNTTMYTDFYQLTKMAMYLESGKENEETTFECFYRTNPFGGGYTVALGLSEVVDYLNNIEFTGKNIDYLKSVWNFKDRFWEYLREFKWEGTLRALSEGTICQPFVPIVQVSAKLPIADFIETRILNLLGGPTITGTKALRMTLSNIDVPWVDMAARRASSYDTGMMIAKYSYIGGAGGCIGTSLVSAGEEYGIPLKGTTSHSSVLAYETQLNSFRSCADVFGEDSVFILDTYGYVKGTQDAITVAKEKGLKKFGGRLDTDDLAFQSRVVREILDANGYKNSKIITSNDLDEYKRVEMKKEGAENDVDGVGTSLICGPLNIVYKPVEIEGRNVMKLSCLEKMTDPCAKNIYRIIDKNGKIEAYIATGKDDDLYCGLYNPRERLDEEKEFNNFSNMQVMLNNILVDDTVPTSIKDLKLKVNMESRIMPERMKSFEKPDKFPLYMSHWLSEQKQQLMDSRIIEEKR